jgi:hypothetical protein
MAPLFNPSPWVPDEPAMEPTDKLAFWFTRELSPDILPLPLAESTPVAPALVVPDPEKPGC